MQLRSQTTVSIHNVTVHWAQVCIRNCIRTIRIWSNGKSTVLEGHEGPVQCLAVLPDGALLSGSNDKTIRRWIGSACQQTITGHSDTVRQARFFLLANMSLAFVTAHLHVVTCVPVASLQVCSDLSRESPCRGLAVVPGLGFVSASHDQTLQIWTAAGESIATLVGHTAIVYRCFSADAVLIHVRS